MSRDPIPFLDLPAQHETIRDGIAAAIAKVVDDQRFILGPEVAALEREVAAYSGAPHAVGCASGSDALILALRALDVGPGSTVVCPAYTFFATAGAIDRLGARIVFADIDPASYNVSAESLAAAIDGASDPKAVIPVHLFGQACDPAVEVVTRDAGASIVHDAAQAIGSTFSDGARMGSRETTCFSFFPTKNLGAYGDAGMLTTVDEDMAARLRSLRAHGATTKYFHDEVGMNSRLDAIQAAILRVKLPYLDEWSDARASNAARYDTLFGEAGAATSFTRLSDGGLPLRTPEPPVPGARHIYNQYVIRVPGELRDPLREHLNDAGIANAVYYPLPLHLQPCFSDLGYREGDLPEAEAASRETLAIPVYAELRPEQQERVVETVVGFLSR